MLPWETCAIKVINYCDFQLWYGYKQLDENIEFQNNSKQFLIIK